MVSREGRRYSSISEIVPARDRRDVRLVKTKRLLNPSVTCNMCLFKSRLKILFETF